MLKPVLEVQQISRFLGFFWMDDYIVHFSHGGMCSLEWKGYLEIKQSSLFTTDHTDPSCVFQQTPHRCKETYIYIYIFIVTYYVYIHVCMWYVYIYIYVEMCPKPQNLWLACMRLMWSLLAWGPMPCPIAPVRRSTAGWDLGPRLASWSRFTQGSSNREESGDHGELPSQTQCSM